MLASSIALPERITVQQFWEHLLHRLGISQQEFQGSSKRRDAVMHGTGRNAVKLQTTCSVYTYIADLSS